MALNLSQAAAELRAAMKGIGTDEDRIIAVVSRLPVKDVKKLNDTYKAEIKRNLIEDIKSECSGNLEDALVAFLTPQTTYDANLVRKAMKGVGTDEDVLLEVICTRSAQELKEIHAEYLNVHTRDLEEDIRSETSGDFKRLLVARLKGIDDDKHNVDEDVEKLYKAGQGKIGTDEAVFVQILANRSKKYIKQLNTAYANKHGKSLAKVIKDEMGGALEKAFVTLVTPVDEYFATKIYEAMKGAGTDDKTLIRILASQRGPHLKEIAAAYLTKYNKSLKAAVADECSGHYKKLLVAAIEFFVEK